MFSDSISAFFRFLVLDKYSKYTKIKFSGNNVTLDDNEIPDDQNEPEVIGTFTKNGSQITIQTFGLMNKNNPSNNHTYVFQIN